jgi:hypothetical protein
MANPSGFNAQQNFFTFGFGIWVLPRLQRLSPLDDLHRTHNTILRFEPLLLPPRAFEEGKMKPYHLDHVGDSLGSS